MKPSLEKFGAFFVRHLRDKMLAKTDELLGGGSKAPELKGLQKDLMKFNDVQKQVIRDLVERLITSGMHDLLFAIQEESGSRGSLKVLVDGEEVAELSDGLHGEIFGDRGWIVRFSEYPSELEIERSKSAAEFMKDYIARRKKS